MTIEEENKELIIELHSHIYEWYETEKINKGIPYPIQTLNCEFPNLKNKKDPDNRFKYKYKSEERIKSEKLVSSQRRREE